MDLQINVLKVIINRTKGMYNYSSDFYKKYEELYGEYNYDEKSLESHINNKIITVFELLGPIKSSSILSHLQIVCVPEEMKNYLEIKVKDGYESIKVNYNKAYRELLFYIMNDNELLQSNDQPKIYCSNMYKQRFNRIKFIEKTFRKK
jgi:hypothetical protein